MEETMKKQPPQIEVHGNVFVMSCDKNTDMEKVSDFMNEVQDGYAREITRISKELGIPEGSAGDIWYLRTRSRWTQEKEDQLIKLAKEGKPLPNVLAGEF